MTIEEAKRISDLLKARGSLVHDLKNIEQCSSINGNINIGCNGLGFSWRKSNGLEAKPDRELTYLIAGYKADIAAIDATLASLTSPNFPKT